MKVIQYKNFDLDQLNLEFPNKNGDTYICEFNYQNSKDFTIQSPELTINSDGVSFKMINKGQFLTLLENLYDKIIELLSFNSKDFFNGKQFTEERLRKSLKKIVSLNIDNGDVKINDIKISKSVKIFNSFMDTVSNLPETPFNCVGIIKLNNISFIKTECYLNLVITHVKLPLDKKKITECIFEDEQESEPEPEPEPETKKIIISENNNESNFFN